MYWNQSACKALWEKSSLDPSDSLPFSCEAVKQAAKLSADAVGEDDLWDGDHQPLTTNHQPSAAGITVGLRPLRTALLFPRGGAKLKSMTKRARVNSCETHQNKVVIAIFQKKSKPLWKMFPVKKPNKKPKQDFHDLLETP